MQSVCPEVRFCETSCKTLWIVTFRGSLVENACFGSLECHFSWKSRGKCLFWKLGVSLLVGESLVAMLVLEAWIFPFGESLVENARVESLDCHFWWQSRGKCAGVSRVKSVKQERPARVSGKSVKQECLARVSLQECQRRVSRKGVKRE